MNDVALDSTHQQLLYASDARLLMQVIARLGDVISPSRGSITGGM